VGRAALLALPVAHGVQSGAIVSEHEARRDVWMEKITEALRALRQEIGHEGDAPLARSPRSNNGERGRCGEQR
jgi:hypothetical protein